MEKWIYLYLCAEYYHLFSYPEEFTIFPSRLLFSYQEIRLKLAIDSCGEQYGSGCSHHLNAGPLLRMCEARN
ncbi:hypothetical protein LAD77_30265 [Klebsiella pneumoniae]|nr:hypothetical protein [Klebsiella pneumoniae]